MSSPVLGADGTAVAALTISIPLSRWSDDLAETYGARTRDAAHDLGPIPSAGGSDVGGSST